MAVVQTITATILIQVGADEPKPIGTVEIPIELNLSPNKPAGISFPPGARGVSSGRPPRGGTGVSSPRSKRCVRDDEWLTDEQVPPVTKIP